MLERVGSFLKDVYSLRPQAWKEHAQTLSTEALQEELRGREKLHRINHRLTSGEMLLGVLAIPLGLVWVGTGLILVSGVTHLPIAARTQRRIDVLTTELQTRPSFPLNQPA